MIDVDIEKVLFKDKEMYTVVWYNGTRRYCIGMFEEEEEADEIYNSIEELRRKISALSVPRDYEED